MKILLTKKFKIAFSVFGAAIISVLPLEQVSAAILVEPIVTTRNENIIKTKNPRKLGSELQPGQVVEYGVPDNANNLLNATGKDMGSFVFDLKTLTYSNPNSTPAFNNELVQWGDVDGDGKIGFSNTDDLTDIFKNVVVKDNLITFSGGVIPDGTVFFNQFVTQPNLKPGGGIIPPTAPPPADQDGPIRVSAYYTAIPEPNSILGLLVFGSLGLASMFKHTQKQCKNTNDHLHNKC